MPTFAIEIREKNKRRDEKFPVSIRMTHLSKQVNLPTGVYVTRQQINSDFSGLKDNSLNRAFFNEIHQYERMLTDGLGINLRQYNAKELVNYINLQKANSRGAGIDFIAFSNEYISELEKRGQDGYAESFRVAIRNLTDYFGRSFISIKEINIENLSGFIEYMQKPRAICRTDKFGRLVKMHKNGVKPQTVKDYLGDVKTLFNAACDKFSDEDSGFTVITHNPFKGKNYRLRQRKNHIKDFCRSLTSQKY